MDFGTTVSFVVRSTERKFGSGGSFLRGWSSLGRRIALGGTCTANSGSSTALNLLTACSGLDP